MADSDVSTPVHKYLVCIDHSRWAESAFNSALTHMNLQHDELHLMSVIEDDNYADFAGAAYAYDIVIRSRRVFREKTKKFLRWFGVKAKKLGVAKDVHLIIAHGSPGSLICEYIDERGIDSVYMGRRGLGAIERLFIGSVSKYVVENSHCTVVIVKKHVGEEEVHESNKEHVLLLEEQEKNRKIEEVKELEDVERKNSENNRYLTLGAGDD